MSARREVAASAREPQSSLRVLCLSDQLSRLTLWPGEAKVKGRNLAGVGLPGISIPAEGGCGRSDATQGSAAGESGAREAGWVLHLMAPFAVAVRIPGC